MRSVEPTTYSLKGHYLDDCMAVWYNPYLLGRDSMAHCEEVCEQGYADLKFNGINWREARVARRAR